MQAAGGEPPQGTAHRKACRLGIGFATEIVLVLPFRAAAPLNKEMKEDGQCR